MSVRHPRVWIAAISVGAVAGLVASDLHRTAPGPISAVHEREPELVGLWSCQHCHGGWFGGMASSCLECHPRIAQQLAKGNGLHGSLDSERSKLCGACHSEHHGKDFVLVNRLSFAMAGVPESQKFDHRQIGFEMSGRHLELACKQCHPQAETELLPKGGTRYLGLVQDCASCHEDAHQGAMQIGCVKCHGQVEFKRLESKDHAKHLALTGGHAGVDCRKCHAPGTAHALEALGQGQQPRVRQCADCHESPHGQPFLASAARLAGQPVAATCVACHRPEHESFHDERLQLSAEQHAGSGFLLDDPHDEVDCAKCHDPKRKDFQQRYPGRGQDDCNSCHEDVHRAEFAGKRFAERGCIDCHARTQFLPHEFTAEKHARTKFALEGVHAQVDCHQCHPKLADGIPARFGGAETRCERCHADAHDGCFDRHGRELRANKQGTCAHCHRPTKFGELLPGGFDHLRWTGFAVTGAHEQAGCESCHAREVAPDDRGRTFGKVTARFGKVAGCVTCHLDPHEGAFDRPALPTRVEGRTDCARCHVDTSFRGFPGGFDHGRWTRFPLQGAHGRLDCARCHARLAEPDPNGRTWRRARGTLCADCHEEPHAGQFAVDGKTDCRPCHQGSEKFRDEVFRHDVHSRFLLGEQHERLECGACHKPFREGNRDVIRYRPLPSRCIDCHRGVESPFQKRNEERR